MSHTIGVDEIKQLQKVMVNEYSKLEGLDNSEVPYGSGT